MAELALPCSYPHGLFTCNPHNLGQLCCAFWEMCGARSPEYFSCLGAALAHLLLHTQGKFSHDTQERDRTFFTATNNTTLGSSPNQRHLLGLRWQQTSTAAGPWMQIWPLVVAVLTVFHMVSVGILCCTHQAVSHYP